MTRQERTVRFKDMEELKKFAALCQRMEADIDIEKKNIIIDAKSLLGLISMGLNQEMKLVVFDCDKEEVDRKFSQFFA